MPSTVPISDDLPVRYLRFAETEARGPSPLYRGPGRKPPGAPDVDRLRSPSQEIELKGPSYRDKLQMQKSRGVKS